MEYGEDKRGFTCGGFPLNMLPGLGSGGSVQFSLSFSLAPHLKAGFADAHNSCKQVTGTK